MSIHTDQVLDYLDTHLVCRNAEGMDSLLWMIYEAYLKHNEVDNSEIRYLLGEQGSFLDFLPSEQAKAVLSGICDLCQSHEVLAFSQGVLTGMQLMTEVNMLP